MYAHYVELCNLVFYGSLQNVIQYLAIFDSSFKHFKIHILTFYVYFVYTNG